MTHAGQAMMLSRAGATGGRAPPGGRCARGEFEEHWFPYGSEASHLGRRRCRRQNKHLRTPEIFLGGAG